MVDVVKSDRGTYYIHRGTSTADNEVLLTTDEMSDFDAFEILGSAGAVDVEVQLYENGEWTTVVVALEDQGATASGTYVVVTVVNRLYRFTGNYHAVRLRQAGATAANYTLRAWRRGA